MFFKIKKKIDTPAELKLEEIKNILFPPLELRNKPEQDGGITKFHIDYSVDSNLDAIMMDLQDGINDSNIHKSINSLITRLHKVRTLLEAYAELDKDAKYIIVDDDMDGG